MPPLPPSPARMPHRTVLAFRSCSCRQKAKTGAGTEAGTGAGAGVGLGFWPTAVGLISRRNRTRVLVKFLLRDKGATLDNVSHTHTHTHISPRGEERQQISGALVLDLSLGR